MSITISVGANGAATGRKEQIIPGDGGIDTKEEAEAALAYLPEGSTDTVSAGNQSYTRAQLLEIRDRSSAPAPQGEAVPGEGVSHGVALEGHGTADKGDVGHGGQGVSLTYRLGIPLTKGSGHQLHLDVIGGPEAGHYSRDFSTPGGEAVKSAFTRYGGVLGVDGRYSPPLLNNRFYVALGFRGGVSAFGTQDGETVSTPGKCTPGDFGRSECEPSAGPRTGNAGTKGLWNPRIGSAAGSSGVVLSLEFPLAVGGTVVRGDWGSLDLQGGPLFSLKKMMPSGGDGFSFASWGGFGGVVMRFGGSAAYKAPETVPAPIAPPVADKDGDGVPDAQDKCADTPKGAKVDASGCPILTYDAKIVSSPVSVRPSGKFSVTVKANAKSEVSIQFKDAAGKLTGTNPSSATVTAGDAIDTSEFDVPSALPAGKYKLVVTMRDPESKTEKVEERDIVIVERVTADDMGTFAPNQKPVMKNIRVQGADKIEDVTYSVEGFDKEGKSVGTAKSAKPVTIDAKKSQIIIDQAPEKGGFRKDVKYTVTLLNKDGFPIVAKQFEIGEMPPAPKGGGGRKRL